ncbi:XRE family transcriptional regulator [Marivirga tractuosa]|uniref:XRE family transcriptional regulator n=1 Tax=Marivirga tractuosa TaxID=1006 RepID=UPI0035D0FCF3
MEFNYKQLTFAREYRKYSQTELASRIPGLSQSNLSKFEKGLDTLSNDLIEKIIDFLDFPKEFFQQHIPSMVENAEYRRRATITKGDRLDIEYSIRFISHLIDQMSNAIEWPDLKLKAIDIEDGFSPVSIAKLIRKQFKLKNGEPVKNIFSIIEQSGIIIYELDANEKFDGVSFQTENGFPLIIVNSNFSNDRKRFTLAHELGHLVMHVLTENPISEYRNKEKEADQFASEFLMPEDGIRNSLLNLKLSYLADLKSYWLTSMGAIIRKAKDLHCISADKYKYLNIELSRRGWKKNEPVHVFIDSPKLFSVGYKLHKNDLEYSDEELSKAFRVPTDVVKRYYNLPRGESKLRVVI